MRTIVEIKKDVFYEENDIVVRRSKLEDAKRLAPLLSKNDIHEAWAINHSKPLEALERGLDKSIFALTIENKRNIVGMLGIIPDEILGNKACIWFLASDELKDIGRVFLSNAKGIIDILLSYYPYLYNYVHIKNDKSILWMKWCGFKIEEPKPVGIENEMFHYFSIERK